MAFELWSFDMNLDEYYWKVGEHFCPPDSFFDSKDLTIFACDEEYEVIKKGFINIPLTNSNKCFFKGELALFIIDNYHIFNNYNNGK